MGTFQQRRIIFFFLAFTLLECSSLLKKAFTPPKVSVEKIDILDVALSGVKLQVHIVVDNPNFVGIKLNRVAYEVIVEGQTLVKGNKADPIDLKGNFRNTFTFPITVKFSGLQSGIAGIINKDKIKFRVLAKITLNTPIKDLTFDIDENGQIKIPDAPTFELLGVKVTEKSMESITLVFNIKISNNQDLKLDIKRLQYYVSLNDFEVSKEKLTVNRKVSTNLNAKIPVNIQLMNLKRSLVDIMYSGSLKYKFDIDIVLNSTYGEFSLPFSKESLIKLF